MLIVFTCLGENLLPKLSFNFTCQKYPKNQYSSQPNGQSCQKTKLKYKHILVFFLSRNNHFQYNGLFLQNIAYFNSLIEIHRLQTIETALKNEFIDSTSYCLYCPTKKLDYFCRFFLEVNLFYKFGLLDTMNISARLYKKCIIIFRAVPR